MESQTRQPQAPSKYMAEAIALASEGRYGAPPNPMVGAVLVRAGAVVGRGYHAKVGQAHAEVAAFADAGESARGADLYVTLEPCSHHGRTPPCTEAVIAAGVRRVVCAHLDPDPRVAGRGIAQLRAAGIAVEVGDAAEEARELNWKYLVHRVHQRPAVTLKWAMTLDGRIATRSGDAKWISSPAARHWSLELREVHQAILVGSGTVLADDPRLDRRRGRADSPILRVVLDRRLRTPPGALLFGIPGPVVIFTEAGVKGRTQELERAGAEVVRLGEVTPHTVLAELGARGVQAVLVEGGAMVHGAFFDAGLADRVEVVVAPVVVGGADAPGPIGGRGVEALAEGWRLERVGLARRGGDGIFGGFRPGCLRDLSLRAAG